MNKPEEDVTASIEDSDMQDQTKHEPFEVEEADPVIDSK